VWVPLQIKGGRNTIPSHSPLMQKGRGSLSPRVGRAATSLQRARTTIQARPKPVYSTVRHFTGGRAGPGVVASRW
jgi:hypothetical protein